MRDVLSNIGTLFGGNDDAIAGDVLEMILATRLRALGVALGVLRKTRRANNGK